MKKALIAAALLFGCTGQVLAVGSVADVTVYDRAESRTLPVHYHEDRYYVVGKPDNEYQVNIRNHQSGEILTVISVDGVNAVSGETANWGQPFSRSWRVPLSIAAVILLSVSLMTLIREEAPEIARLPRADAPPPLPEAATYPRKESVAADRLGAGEPPAPLAKSASPEAFPGAPDRRDKAAKPARAVEAVASVPPPLAAPVALPEQPQSARALPPLASHQNS